MDANNLLKAYNRIAEELGGYRRQLWPEAVKFLKKVKPTTVLDLGSGNAFYVKRIESLGHKVIISDFAIKQLQLAKREGVNSPAFVSDVRKLPIKSGSFELVTAFAVLHHMGTKKARLNFLKEVKRILKPGGQALISVIKTRRGGGFDASLSFGKIDRYYHFFTKEELRESLNKIGFSKYGIVSSPLKTIKQVTVNDKLKKIRLGNYFIEIRK